MPAKLLKKEEVTGSPQQILEEEFDLKLVLPPSAPSHPYL